MYISNTDNRSSQYAVTNTGNGKPQRAQSSANNRPVNKSQDQLKNISEKAEGSRQEKPEKTKSGELIKQSSFALASQSAQRSPHHPRQANVQEYKAIADADVVVSLNRGSVRQAQQPIRAGAGDVRGSLVEEQQASRQAQIAIASYHSNQHLEERREFTTALGIDDYA